MRLVGKVISSWWSGEVRVIESLNIIFKVARGLRFLITSFIGNHFDSVVRVRNVFFSSALVLLDGVRVGFNGFLLCDNVALHDRFLDVLDFFDDFGGVFFEIGNIEHEFNWARRNVDSWFFYVIANSDDAGPDSFKEGLFRSRDWELDELSSFSELQRRYFVNRHHEVFKHVIAEHLWEDKRLAHWHGCERVGLFNFLNRRWGAHELETAVSHRFWYSVDFFC